MKPELRFEEVCMTVSELGEEAGVPDLTGSLILQNNLEFHLDEEDGIFEGYGKRTTSYPYRQYNAYNRRLISKQMRTAVLENDFIRAVFLPSLGGRLWELWDKQTGRNLLYTNDVIRYSNLAIRNAWFSGGVEWNLGIIGHTPFTTEQLYTAVLENGDGSPVLRMYEYERLRGVEYQMDFWLGERDGFLNCRMRIVNSGKDVVPMYWWSNMAVPEYKGGRIAVPSAQAFTSRGRDIYKVDVPVVDGVDISEYKNIPKQVDYFFDIPENAPKFIANLDDDGYGLFHISTSRLRSRKLFSWGNNAGSDRWQRFLTEDGGRYLEIQAGIGKTQYGCIPMPPHTAWEWMEQYGPVQIEREIKNAGFSRLCAHMEALAAGEIEKRRPEQMLRTEKTMALTKGRLLAAGSGYGKLERAVRACTGERDLSPHLQYTESDAGGKWETFLKTGVFMEQTPEEKPADFVSSPVFYERLKETIDSINKENWYAHYQLAVLELEHGSREKSKCHFLKSLALAENPWCRHGLAALCLAAGEKEESIHQMKAGLMQRTGELGYVKEGFKILLAAEGYKAVISLYASLPKDMQEESRILFDYMVSLARTGQRQPAKELLKPGFVLDDLREGEDSVSDLWQLLNPEQETVPEEWNFYSL